MFLEGKKEASRRLIRPVAVVEPRTLLTEIVQVEGGGGEIEFAWAPLITAHVAGGCKQHAFALTRCLPATLLAEHQQEKLTILIRKSVAIVSCILHCLRIIDEYSAQI